MHIRPLDPVSDRALVDAFFVEATDYILLERDEPPGPDVTEEFFTDTPPGCDPATSLRIGLFKDGHLIAVGETAFGYPEAHDAYLGLMIVSPRARGTGAGSFLLRHIEAEALARQKKNLYLAVLDANPRGQSFWEREGFAIAATDRPVTLGAKTQTAKRMVKALS